MIDTQGQPFNEWPDEPPVCGAETWTGDMWAPRGPCQKTPTRDGRCETHAAEQDRRNRITQLQAVFTYRELDVHVTELNDKIVVVVGDYESFLKAVWM